MVQHHFNKYGLHQDDPQKEIYSQGHKQKEVFVIVLLKGSCTEQGCWKVIFSDELHVVTGQKVYN